MASGETVITDATRVIGGRDGGILDAGEAVFDDGVPAVFVVFVMMAPAAAAEAAVVVEPPILPLESDLCCGVCGCGTTVW